MDYELPSEFDLVVVGTGLIESVISAAASRIGKTVLHIDTDSYYGGQWASFNLESIKNFTTKPSQQVDDSLIIKKNIVLNEGERIVSLGNTQYSIRDVKQHWNIPETNPVIINENIQEDNSKSEENVDQEKVSDKIDNEPNEVKNESSKTILTQEELLKKARSFNIDLTPKLQYARGDFVELLISSNIARYAEYRSVSRILTYIEDKLEIVPCSRSDVFSNSKVNVIEKRILMKLITTCMEADETEFTGYEDKTFYQYLKDKKLTDNLINYVLYALSMCTMESKCSNGAENIKRFLTSLGRFGKTPFLFSLYGSGEIAQAFCRLSAVFGGVYALNQNINGIIVDSNQNYQGIITGNKKIASNHLVMGIERCPEEYLKNCENTAFISRAVFLLDKSVFPSEKEHLTLLLMPSDDKKSLCNILELGTLTGTCPKNMYLLHMFTKQTLDPVNDLKQYVDKILNITNEISDKPKILWSMYFSIPCTEINFTKNDLLPKNCHVCAGPDYDLDYDSEIEKASAIFKTMYPDDEFLPRAPDPEEIIIGEDNNEENEQNTEENEEKTEENEENEENDGITEENSKVGSSQECHGTE